MYLSAALIDDAIEVGAIFRDEETTHVAAA
jgi:hypothetical protein